MPIREFYCAQCANLEERYVKLRYTPVPPCPNCGATRIQLASRFAVVFTGPLTARYNDPKRENAHQEGFWAHRRAADGKLSGEAVRIESWQDLKEFNRSEGLAAPGDVPTNATISKDGKRIVSDGMPGQWRGALPPIPSRLQEIIDKPLAEFKPAAATAQPCMPMSYGVKPEVTVMPEVAP